MKQIHKYKIDNFQDVHCITTNDSDHFGYANLPEELKIEKIALYSTQGAQETIRPTKADFFRISLCLAGTAKIHLGLENFMHQPGSISFTFPNQLFAKESQSHDHFGYYLFFSSDFLNDLISPPKIETEFPFFIFSGVPFFQLDDAELQEISSLFERINKELHLNKDDRIKAIQFYLYLILIQAKRSYSRQQLKEVLHKNQHQAVVYRFKKLVCKKFLTCQNVSDYAEMLAVTPNYLNRIIKKETSQTASYFIKKMRVIEARALLKHSDLTLTEIAYHLSFTDSAHFSRFFKQLTLVSPSQYRKEPSL